MDRYEYKLKAEELQKLVRARRYEAALAIAEEMDFRKERDVRLLQDAAEAFVAAKRYEEALDLLEQAYEYAPVGRRIIYRLTEVAILAGDASTADAYLREFHEVAPRDPGRYILEYRLSKLKKEPVERRIEILEVYRSHEVDEKWSYQLARLYAAVGRIEESVELCDDIVLWFSTGKYVTKALELKSRYAELTPSQRDRLENPERYREMLRQTVREEEAIASAQEMAEKQASQAEAQAAAEAALQEEAAAVADEVTAEETPAVTEAEEEPAAKEVPEEASEEVPTEAVAEEVPAAEADVTEAPADDAEGEAAEAAAEPEEAPAAEKEAAEETPSEELKIMPAAFRYDAELLAEDVADDAADAVSDEDEAEADIWGAPEPAAPEEAAAEEPAYAEEAEEAAPEEEEEPRAEAPRSPLERLRSYLSGEPSEPSARSEERGGILPGLARLFGQDRRTETPAEPARPVVHPVQPVQPAAVPEEPAEEVLPGAEAVTEDDAWWIAGEEAEEVEAYQAESVSDSEAMRMGMAAWEGVPETTERSFVQHDVEEEEDLEIPDGSAVKEPEDPMAALMADPAIRSAAESGNVYSAALRETEKPAEGAEEADVVPAGQLEFDFARVEAVVKAREQRDKELGIWDDPFRETVVKEPDEEKLIRRIFSGEFMTPAAPEPEDVPAAPAEAEDDTDGLTEAFFLDSAAEETPEPVLFAVPEEAAAEEEPAVEEAAAEEPAVEEEPAAEEEPVAEEPAVEEAAAEEPAVEEPAVAEPVAEEEPAVEEPVAEEPAVEEAAAEEEPVVEEPAAEEKPAIEEPVGEEPAVEEAPVEEEPAAEEPAEGSILSGPEEARAEEQGLLEEAEEAVRRALEEETPQAAAVEETAAEIVEEPAAETVKETAAAVEEPVVEAVEETVTEPVEETAAEAVEETVAAAVEEAVTEPVEETVAAAVEEPVAEAVEETVAEAVEKTVAEAVEETVAEAAIETVTEPVEETVAAAVEESVVEAVEEPAAEAVEETIPAAVEETIREAVEEPAAETVKETITEAAEETAAAAAEVPAAAAEAPAPEAPAPAVDEAVTAAAVEKIAEDAERGAVDAWFDAAREGELTERAWSRDNIIITTTDYDAGFELAMAYLVRLPDDERPAAVARTSGAKLNGKDWKQLRTRLQDKILFVDHAAELSPEACENLRAYLLEEKHMAVLMDSEENIDRLGQTSRRLLEMFEIEYACYDYSTEDIVRHGLEYAESDGWTVEDDARRAYRERIEKMDVTHGREFIEAENIMDDAMDRAEDHGFSGFLRRTFGGKKVEERILKAAHFR